MLLVHRQNLQTMLLMRTSRKCNFHFERIHFYFQFSFWNIWRHYDMKYFRTSSVKLMWPRWSREAVTTNLVCIMFTEITVLRFPPWFAGLKCFFHASPTQQDTFPVFITVRHHHSPKPMSSSDSSDSSFFSSFFSSTANTHTSRTLSTNCTS